MGPCRVNIYYDQAAATLFSGQTLSGYVVVEYDKEITINEISLRISGVARVDWTEKNNDQCYSNYEEFINSRLIIYNQDINNGVGSTPGEHRFPFTFRLPVSLPSTFISPFGFVHYFCKATVQATELNCLTMSSKVKVQEPFTIINDIDVCTFPNMNKEANVSQSQRLPALCCLSRGIVSVSMAINKCAFVIGEPMEINYSVKNQSSAHLVLFHVAIVQKLVYTADSGKRKSDNRNVSNVINSSEIPPHKENEGRVTLSVPSVPPNTLGACKSINISYFAQLSMGEISSCNPEFYLEISLPIVIGTTASASHRYCNVTY